MPACDAAISACDAAISACDAAISACDAAISAWDAKRRHDFVRPISAIRHLFLGQMIEAWGGPNQGTQTIPGETWQLYQSLTFVPPPFAEYVSGHSTFSRTGREVLLAFTGSDVLYAGVTHIGEDYDGDGEECLLGQHSVPPINLLFEDGPAPQGGTGRPTRYRPLHVGGGNTGASKRAGAGLIGIDGGELPRL